MNDNHDEEHGSFLSKLFSKKGEPSNQNELEQVIHEASENDVIDLDTTDLSIVRVICTVREKNIGHL